MSMSIARPPQAKHRLTSCDRHPGEPITGFCAPCLSERLSGLDYVNTSSSSYSSFPELRRSKSFSGNHNGNNFSVAGGTEPRRKSCDVRVPRSTLSCLFSLEDGRDNAASGGGVDNWNLGLRKNVGTVFEEEEDEIRILEEEENVPNVVVQNTGEVEENAGEEEDNAEELKTMKEHIDLEWKHGPSSSNSRRNFWVVASVFSKKLMTWRQKQKIRLANSVSGGGHSNNNSVEVGRVNARETQSEIGEYGFYGRRSCDTDPRFSVDGGRVSLDCSRLSFDQPRASCDGHVSGRGLPRRVISEGKIGGMNQLGRSPGGSAEIREYYLDSLSRRRSFDQCGLDKRSGGGAALEVEEIKTLLNSNSKVSPTTMELFHGARVLLTESDLTESNLSMDGLRNDGSESTDTSSSVAASVTGCGDRKGFKMFGGWRKAWTIWGSIQKRDDNNKYKDVREPSCRNSLERLDRVSDGEAGLARNIRSHSSSLRSSRVSRSSTNSSAVVRGYGNERTEHFVLERNKSARYSPNNHDHGLLRFYLTPLRSRRKSCKSRLK